MRKFRQFLSALVAVLLIAVMYAMFSGKAAAQEQGTVTTTGWQIGADPTIPDLLRKIDHLRWLHRLANVKPRPKPKAPAKRS